jgi:hypothetical protein
MPVEFISRRFGNQGRLIVAKLLLPLLILTTPFLVFLRHHSYCLRCNEVMISLSGLVILAAVCSVIMILSGSVLSSFALAGLLSFFLDIQFTHSDWVNLYTRTLLVVATLGLCWKLKEKFYVVITSVFAIFFIVTVFELVLTPNGTAPMSYRNPAADAPPRIIHLILDEHIGVEGIPADIDSGNETKRRIRDFYLRNGFRLYGGAFSHYFNTHHSISNMLNFSNESNYDAFVTSRDVKKVLRNKYFTLLAERKYRLNVVSPGELDYCSGAAVIIDNCVNYHSANLREFAKLTLPIRQKLQVLTSVYFRQSGILSKIVHKYSAGLRSLLSGVGISWLDWTWALDLERTRMDSLNTLASLDGLWRNVLSLKKGNVLFVHLMLPHFPYVAHANCSIVAPGREYLWTNNVLFTEHATNTPVSREERYRFYFEQLECLYLRLDDLFNQMRAAGMYDDSIFIIHSDHGSRIISDELTLENQQRLSEQDFLAGFSTLFAIKVSGNNGGYDSSPLPLEQLLKKFLVETKLAEGGGIDFDQSSLFVYVAAKDGDTPRVRVPYPHEVRLEPPSAEAKIQR